VWKARPRGDWRGFAAGHRSHRIIEQQLDRPRKQVHVALTEHKEEDFHRTARYLGDWTEGEQDTDPG